MSEDPFPQVRQEVQASWTSLRSERLPKHEQMARLDALDSDVHDLEVAIEITRSEPTRFQISASELADRTVFVGELKRALASYRETIGQRGAQRGALGTRMQDGVADETHRANESFVNDQMRLQTDVLAEQDEHLDELSNAVQRIGNLGRDMHVELEQQGDLLDDLGGRFDGTVSRMKAVRQRVEVVMERTGRRECCTMLWLSVTFLVLTLLVVLT